jgi:hypothetical protein
MTDERKYPAAYLPYSTLITGLDHLKTVSIPNRIEGGTFPAMSSQSASQMLSALRFFKLIDANGIPQPGLTPLVNNQAERPELLKALIEEHYADIVKLDLSKMTPSQLDEAFDNDHYNVSGETKKKAKTFLLKAAKAAGFKVHPLLVKITRNRKSAWKKSNSTTVKFTPIDYNNLDKDKKTPPPTNGTQKTIQLSSGGSLTLSVDLNVLELKGEDRKFVFELIDQIDAFETNKTSGAKKTALPVD